MTEREQFLLGQLSASVARLEDSQRDTHNAIAEIQRILNEQAGERRAMKWFYSAAGAALTGLATLLFKLAGFFTIGYTSRHTP